MASIPWTIAQKKAIVTTGRSVLVSAGAGSGKTAVLAERCVHLVLDAAPPSRMDRLLVVTFTEAAAAQMRDRIGKALRERLTRDPNNTRVRQQLALLDGASISTLHAFCKRVLDRYFAQAGVEPASPIMDAQDASILRQDLAEAVFRDAAHQPGEAGDRFHNLVQALGAGREYSLIRLVLDLDAFLDSIADSHNWLSAAKSRVQVGADGVLPESWRNLLARQVAEELTEQSNHVDRAIHVATSKGEVGALFKTCLNDYADALATWRHNLGRGASASALDAVCANGIGRFKFPAIPRAAGKAVAALTPAQRGAFEQLQESCREIREVLFNKRLTTPFGRFTCQGWADGLQRVAPHVETLVELVTELRTRYADEKEQLGVLDFSDLERRTLKVLQDRDSGVARGLRDKFDHVLVDEFQDVNPIQAEILHRVSREDDPHRADNLFAVGDIKQSIYRFRLAEPRLFLERLARFRPADESIPSRNKNDEPTLFEAAPSDTASPPGVAIDLVENFRSDEHVIDAVNAVMARLMTPDLGGVHYDDRSRLVHGLPKSNAVCAIPGLELHLLEDTSRAKSEDGSDPTAASDRETPPSEDAGDWERIEREAWVIARRIELLHAAGTPYRDMVILLRSLAHRAPLMIRALARMGVPVHADVAGGFFDALEVNDCLSLLAVLDNSQQDLPLAALMRSPLMGRPFSDTELVLIRTHEPSRRAPFHAAVFTYAASGKNETLRERLSVMLNRLADWRRVARERSLSDLVWQLLHDTHYLAYVEGLPQGEQRRANLIALHDHARKFGTFERQGLHRFLSFIEQMRDADMDLEPAPLKHASADVVRVMSIHRSKGLEFPVVFVAELGKRFNISDASGSILFDRELGLGLKAVDVQQRIIYPTLAHQLVSRQIRAESLSEEMRVLYVALTRAKDRLILVGTGKIERVDEHVASAFADGPLPALDRRSATSALDWVLPAICAAPQKQHQIDRLAPQAEGLPDITFSGKAPLFHTRVYPATAMANWKLDPPRVVNADERLTTLSTMGELPEELGASGPAADLDILKRRLVTPYLAASLTAIPAVVAASELKRRWEHGPQIDGEPTAAANRKITRDFRFAPPEFIGLDDIDASTRRGTSTHAFLQHVDLRRTCDRSGLEAQLKEMIERGVVLESEAAEINLDEAAWFFDSTLGRRMLSSKAQVRREWPFVMAASPQRFDSAAAPIDGGDQLLVRGIIDCLLNDDGRWDIIDYKTDRVSGAALAERVQLYRGQLSIYADAVEKLWPGKVGQKCLVFLNARQWVEV